MFFKIAKSAITILLALSAVTIGEEAKPIILRGKVVDSNSQPVAGVEVTAYENFADYYDGPDYQKMLCSVEKTDSKGCFKLNVNIKDQYFVFIVARKEGYALGWDCLNFSNYVLAEGNFNIILEKPGVLAGRLVDANERPIANTKVQAVPVTSYSSRLRDREIYAPKDWFTVQTDQDGNFVFKNLAEDVSAGFWVQAPGSELTYKFARYRMSGFGFDVGRKDVKLTMPCMTKIKGCVIDKETRKSVAGIELLLKPDDFSDNEYLFYPFQLTSGADGKFEIDGVPPGKHILRVKPGSDWIGKLIPIDIKPGEKLKEVTVRVEKGGFVEATVYDEKTNKLLSDVRVSVHNGDYPEARQAYGFYRTAFTDKKGMARIAAPIGNCEVQAWRGKHSRPTEAIILTVSKNGTTKIKMPLPEDSEPVKGTVFDQSNKPVSGAIVEVHPFGDMVFTNNSGAFEARQDITYPAELLTVRDERQNLAAAVEIKDVSKPIKATLESGLTITGRVCEANGTAIPAARFTLWVPVSNAISNFNTEVLADTNGRYEMNAIPPAKEQFGYRFSVNAAGYRPIEFRKVTINGKPGETIDMGTTELQPATESISGVVVDAEGKPAARVPVFLNGKRDKAQPHKSTATDANGLFVINRICKGPVRLQASFVSDPGGAGFLDAEGGGKDVKIIIGKDLVHTKHAELENKKLPELKELGIELAQADVNDKMLLICFFDFQQRASRNMIKELAEREANLKDKGVIVAGVQASKISQNTLNEWIKQYKISFPVGQIADDEEKTKFDWGVKSLPWLILTDKEHIVKAEGFAINELDGKLKEK
jgi:protocatechuate 3,4-dioxygenase beta subunit